jgi:parallel beta-helix repeat protein
MRWKVASAAILLMGLLLVVPMSSQLSWGVVRRKSVSEHTPIRIVGDGQFDRMHGVTRGSGTITDPYLIEAWDIDSSSAKDTCAGIVLENTTAYVTIRNVRIHGPSACEGIQMSNVSNARIEGNVLTANGRGIAIVDSSSVMVLENMIGPSLEPIAASHSRTILIQDNIVRSGDQGIVVEDSSHVSIVGNVVANSTANGVILFRSFNNTIDSNEVTNTAFRGIALFNSSRDIVARNVVSRAGEQCFYMSSGRGNILTGNFAEDCGWGGIEILNGSGITASGNEVRRSAEAGIGLSGCSNSALIANEVSNSRLGVEVASDSDFNIVVNNTINSSSIAGIVLVGSPSSSPDYNLIQGNTVLDSGEFDLDDLSDGEENMWRLNVYSTANVPTLP